MELVSLLEARGVYADMQWWESIRHRVLRQSVSKRQVMRETGIHRPREAELALGTISVDPHDSSGKDHVPFMVHPG